MTEMMKALVTYAPYDYRYEDYPKPVAGEGEILLKVRGCGICAGDVKAYHGGIRIWGTSSEDRYIEPPCVGGHEFYGEVVELGEGVKDFTVGDVVVSEQIVPCKECQFCRTGVHWMCQRSAVYGFKQYANGGFAEYVKLPANSINYKVPESFTPEQSVLVEPIACGMHAAELGRVEHSDVVVVAGLGAIGLSIVNQVKRSLPRLVIGIDIKKKRIAMAKDFGADVVLNPLECDVVTAIRELTGGLGCDLYIEASGSPKSVSQGLNALKNQGRYVQMGVFAEEVRADWNIIGDGKELKIIGSHLSAKTYPSVIEGIARGLIRTEGLISHTFPLQDWKEAFRVAEEDGEAIKVMLVP